MNTSLTEFERHALDQLIGHPCVEVLWSANSRSARILGVRSAGGAWVVKMPGWDTLEVFTPDERRSSGYLLNRATAAFQQQLTDLDVVLPDHYEIKEIMGFPVHLCSDHGEDCAQIARRDPSQLPAIIGKIVTSLNGVFERGNEEIGIDARMSNFCLSPEGHTIYIDIFPPLIRFEGHYLVHFPNPSTQEEIKTEIQRKFRPFGILRRLRFDMLASDPSRGEEFVNALQSVRNINLRKELAIRFSEMPDQQVRHLSRRGRRDLLKSLTFGDVDSYREIAAVLIPPSEVRDAVLAQVFAATSFVGISKNERLARFERFMNILDPYL